MTTTTVLLILLSLAVSGGLSYYQYFYKASRSAITPWLALLRFISVFAVLLLLINPVVAHKDYEVVKTPLALLVDNSASIKDLKAQDAALQAVEKLRRNNALRDKFDIQSLRFSETTQQNDTLDFSGKQTRIDAAAQFLKDQHRNKAFPVVLLSDGNQTSGGDYAYAFGAQQKVYPVILGDTTTQLDLRITRLNANKYAFLKNRFPVEVFLQYSGSKTVNAEFSIGQGKNVLHRERLSFGPNKKSAVLEILLPADKIGLQVFQARVQSAEKEKNTYNNVKNFAVEVLDQRTEIAIVSAIMHPDLGALKRAIESNAQRKVTILKPSALQNPANFNVILLYQPTGEFKSLMDRNKAAGVNTFTITGTATDFQFLNMNQQDLVFRMSGQSEDYLAAFNPQFNLFAQEDANFSGMPPLQNAFGNITVNGKAETLLSSRIRNVETGAPLLTFFEGQGRRSAYLLGENIWKWRLQDHADHKSFEKFDQFADKIIQFLSSNNQKKSLVVNHERFYNAGEPVEIEAQFFNKNYEFDEKARLSVTLTNKATKAQKQYDLLRSGNAFKVNLDGLPAGAYSFTVTELNSKSRYNGSFELLDFDIEKQFVNPDVAKLKQLATQNGGKTYLPDALDDLVEILLKNPDYQAVQKASIKREQLIEWMWLLVVLAVTLAGEWFLRKYHGLS